MSDWQIFFWAMLHHPDFQYCYIQLPLTLRWDWHKQYGGNWQLSLNVHFWARRVCLPYSVRDAHYKAHTPLYGFDDIPF